MSNSFEILMNQLGMPAEMSQDPALSQADIERVVVHKISKVWEFHFVFSNILPIEIFLELKKGLSEEFSKTGNKAVFEIKALSQEFSNQLLQAYYREAFSEGPCASQGFKSLYQNLRVRAEGIALQKLAEEDPTFRVETNVETGETVISGMGELHLDVLVDRMRREFKVEANVGAPQVSYRETFRASTQARGFFKRQSGGKGQFGDVWIEFTPNEEGKGFEFENAIVGGVVPREFIPAVEKGLVESMANGVLAGYPMVDVKAKLYDGSYHDVDSSETAFKIAASLALKEAAKSAQPAILEPMMLVTITVPEENLGDVMGHVTARRGRVDGMEAHGNSQIVRAYVPLAEMFGYATVLRSASQGRGTFMMVFDHYEDVPKSVQEEIIKKNKGED